MMNDNPRATKERGIFFRRSAAGEQSRPYDFAALYMTFRRYRSALLIWILACLTLAGVYVVLTPAEYTAYTQIVLETPKRPRLVLDADGDAVPIDSAQADSRIQVIRSERLLRFVFDTLELGRKPDVSPPGLLSLFFKREKPSAQVRDTEAFLEFMDRVSARRIGLSYVLELSYRAKTPDEAAHMVNSITSAYIRDLVMSAPSDSEIMQRRIFTVSHDAEILMAAVKTGTIPKTPIVGIDARVIGAAIEPLHKSAPHTFLTLIFALLVGITTGAAFVLFMHNRDKTVRSKSAAKRLCGPDLVGHISRTKLKDGIESLVHALPLDRERTRLGFVSWQNAAATTSVTWRLAERLSDDHAVSLLTATPADPRFKHGLNLNQAASLDLIDIDLDRSGCGIGKLLEIEGKHATSHIIVDLPPLDTSSAALSIGKVLDGVFLIIESDATTEDDLLMALDTLDAMSVVFLGFILYSPEPSANRGRFRLGFAAIAEALASRRSRRRTTKLPRLNLRTTNGVDASRLKLRD